MKYKKLPSQSHLQTLFKYEPSSGVLLRIKTQRDAGTCRKDGYWQVSVDGTTYLKHRIIWMMMHGDIPDGFQVDHINRDPSDNRLANLRSVPVSLNQFNCKLQSNNTSGHCGVSWHKRRTKWLAHIRVDGKRHQLGFYSKKADAAKAREAAVACFLR